MPDVPNFDDWVKSKPAPRGYDPDSALDLIAQHESGGRNIKQNIVPAGGGFNPSVGRVTGPSTAGGPWQITNTTWNKRAPREITQKYPTAMSAPVEVQRDVARKIFNETGFQDWAPYNAGLRKAIAKGDQPRSKVSTDIPKFDDWAKSQGGMKSTPNNLPPQGWGRGTIGQGVKTAPVKAEIPRTRAQVQGEVQPSESTIARKGLRQVTQSGGVTGGLAALLPTDASDWINEGIAKGTAGLMPLAAGVIKHIPGAQDPLDPQRADATKPIRQQLNRGAGELTQATAAIDKDANRGVISQTAQDVGAGFISSAPALALQRAGVPAPIAFGLDSYLKAEGRDAEFADVLKETGLGALTGALFSIPVSQRMGVVKQVAARMGIVGGGTYALTGDWKNSLINAVFHATGAKTEARPELAPAIPASKPREFAPTLAPSELAKRTALREGTYEGRMGVIEEGIPETSVEVPEGVSNVKTGRVSARTAEPVGTEPAAVETPRIQNRRVRNVVTGTKGQFKKGFKQEVTEAQPQEVPPPEAVGKESPATAFQPETKPSRLAQGVEAKAIEAKLTEGFEGLPEYKTVNVKDQAQRATELLDTNPEQARKIAMGDAAPEGDLTPEAVFTAVENRALANNDIDTLRALASESTRSLEATGMGQRIRLLRERSPNSPVQAIAKVEEARAARIPKKQMQKVQNKIKTEIEVEMKQTAPKAGAWAKFLEEIVCK